MAASSAGAQWQLRCSGSGTSAAAQCGCVVMCVLAAAVRKGGESALAALSGEHVLGHDTASRAQVTDMATITACCITSKQQMQNLQQ